MKFTFAVITLFVSLTLHLSVSADSCPSLLKFVKRQLNSQDTVNFCQAYQGKTVLFVNTASKCGFTSQFEGLEALYQTYKDKGLVVLGFPSHDFKQELSDEKAAAEFCQLTYGVKFPMFEPVHVKGDDIDPLFRMLKNKSGTRVKWNFYKYLMAPDGSIVDSYSPMTSPTNKGFIRDIEANLPKAASLKASTVGE